MEKYVVLVEYRFLADGAGWWEDHFLYGVFDTPKEVELIDRHSVIQAKPGYRRDWLIKTVVYRGNGTQWKKLDELSVSLDEG